MKARSQLRYHLLEAIQTEGRSGLVRVVARMIDPNGISADCLVESDNAFDSAATPDADGRGIGADQIWDAAIDMARCLRDARLFEEPDPEEPDPQPDPDPVPDPDFGADESDSAGVLVLAALLVELHSRGKG